MRPPNRDVFIRRFDAIEVTHTHDKAEQLLWALRADLNQLAISTRDYAEWDDAQWMAAGNAARDIATLGRHTTYLLMGTIAGLLVIYGLSLSMLMALHSAQGA